MESNHSYLTLMEATDGLKERGFTHTFKMEDGKMICIETEKNIEPKDVQILEFHRFEGETNPSDMSIVYAVECEKCTKGIIVAAYGMYADMDLVEFIQEVELHSKDMLTN